MIDEPRRPELLAAQVRSLKHGVLTGKDLWALRDEVAALISKTSNEVVYSVLDEMRTEFRTADDELSEDRVMDLMDCVVGWCGPQVKL